MKHFQKIAIGLLGLTHPEMFVPRWKPDTTSAAEIEPSYGRGSRELRPRLDGSREPGEPHREITNVSVDIL
jgi:hypothetical protein